MQFPHCCMNQRSRGKGDQQQPSPPHGQTGKFPSPGSKEREEKSNHLLHDRSNTKEPDQEIHQNEHIRQLLMYVKNAHEVSTSMACFCVKGTTDGKLE